jgi:hypothetical protein
MPSSRRTPGSSLRRRLRFRREYRNVIMKAGPRPSSGRRSGFSPVVAVRGVSTGVLSGRGLAFSPNSGRIHRARRTRRSTAAMPASICAMAPRCPAAGPVATPCAPGSGWPETFRTIIARHPARIAGLCCNRTSRHDRTQPDPPAHRRPPWSARFAEGVSLTTTPRSSVWKKSTASWKTPISGTTPNARRPWAASARCSTRPSTASAI